MAETISFEELRDGLLSPVKNVMTTDENTKSLDEVKAAVEALSNKLGQPLQQIVKNTKAYANAAIGAARGSGGKSTQEQQKISKTLGDIHQIQEKMFKEFKSQNTMWVGISKFGPTAMSQLKSLFRGGGSGSGGVAAAFGGGGGGGGGRRGGGGGGLAIPTGGGGRRGGPAAGGGGIRGLGRAAGGMMAAAGALELFATKALGLVDALGVRLSTAWSGVIKDQAKFQRNMRDIMYLQAGFVKENRELEQSYMDITSQVSASGGIRARFQESWIKMTERGIKLNRVEDRKEKNRGKARDEQVKSMKAITTTSLATAKQLGIEGGTMSELMGDWAFHLDMGEFSLANMGREMQAISRSTGVVGKRFESAVKAADKFMKIMKSAANLTEKASTNLIAMTTAFEKRGILEQFSSTIEGLSSRSSFFEIDDKTRNFLVQMAAGGGQGAMGNLMFGRTLKSAENITKLQQGLGPILQRYLGQVAKDQLGINKITTENLTQVVEQLQAKGVDLSIIDQQLKSAFGKGLGDIVRFNEGLNEARDAMRPYQDRMADLEKQINAEIAAGRGLLDSTKEMQKRFEEMKTDSAMTAFSKATEAIQKGFDGNWVKSELEKALGKDMAADFQNDPAKFARVISESMSRRAQDVGKDFGALLQKRGIGGIDELNRMLAAGGDQQVNAMRALNEAQQELSTLEKDAQDPINAMQRDLHEINNRLGGWFADLLQKLDYKTLVGVIVAAIASAVGANILMGGRIAQTFRGLFGTFGRGFTRARAGGAGVVGATGRGVRGAYMGATRGGMGLMRGGRSLAMGGARAASGGLRAALGAGSGGALLAVFAAVDGIMGAVTGWQKATENFSFALKDAEGNTKEVTWGMKAASAHAGAVVGILDGLTLGLLSIIGVKEPLEKFFSWWYYTFWVVIENIVAGIKEGFAEAIAYFQPAFDYLQEAWNTLKHSLVELGNALGFSGDTIGEVMKSIWEFIGPVAKVIGKVVGWIAGGVGAALAGILGLVIDLVSGVIWCVTQIVKFFTHLWDVLVGNSIIPDLVFGIIKFFALLPIRIMKGLWSLVKKLPGLIWEGLKILGGLAKEIPGLIWEGLKALPGLMWNVMTFIPTLLWNVIKGLGGLLWEALKALPGLLWQGLKALPGLLWNAVKGLGGMIWDGLKALPGLLFDGMKNALVNAWKYFKGWITNAKDWVTGGDIQKNINKTHDSIQKGEAKHYKVMDERLKKIENPEEKLKEAERQAASNADKLKGHRSHVKRMEKDGGRGGRSWIADAALPDWTGLDAGANAHATSLKRNKELTKTLSGRQDSLDAKVLELRKAVLAQAVEKGGPNAKAAQAALDKLGAVEKANKEKSSIVGFHKQYKAQLEFEQEFNKFRVAQEKAAAEQKKTNDVTKKTMEAGQKKGSIFVHDTHCEALLILILKAMGAWTDETMGEYTQLQSALKTRAVAANGEANAQNLGAFGKGHAMAALSGATNLENQKLTGGGGGIIDKAKNFFAKMLGLGGAGGAGGSGGAGGKGGSFLGTMLSSAFSSMSSQEKSKMMGRMMNPQNLGAFGSGQAGGAMGGALGQMLGMIFGGDAEKQQYLATKGNLGGRAGRAYGSRKFGKTGKSADFSLGRALYGATEGVPVSTNPVGDRDELRGQVNPLIAGGTVQDVLARRKAGEAGAGGGSGGLLPDMAAISTYLLQHQSRKLDEMIWELREIRKNTSPSGGGTTQVGPQGSPAPMVKPSYRRTARSRSRGQLNLQPLENQPSSVNV